LTRSTLTRLAVASGFYILLLIVLRSILPETLAPTLPLLALPLVVLALILTLNLSDRSTSPSESKAQETPRRILAMDVQSLTRQVEVAGRSSPGYFDTVVRKRLRDLLVDKVSLETGMERESVRRTLADKTQGPLLLRDFALYQLLYYPPARKSGARLQMLRETIERLESWKA